jgi:probable HAF family extracellular repeat protein
MISKSLMLIFCLYSCISNAFGHCSSFPQRLQFSVTDLGTLGGPVSHASAINDQGQVVGESTDKFGHMHAFLWFKGKISDLGAFEGGRSYARAINDNGEIVGCSSQPHAKSVLAVAWVKEKLMPLFPGDSRSSMAECVNTAGTIAGEVSRSGLFVGFNKDGTNLKVLSSRISEANVHAINRQGSVVGTMVLPGSSPESASAFLWKSGELQSLPVPSGINSSTATAINASGTIAGWLEPGQPMTLRNGRPDNLPCIWQVGKSEICTILSTTGGSALSINDSDLIVGETDIGNLEHAALWKGQSQFDLNALTTGAPGWVLMEATGVNNNGQIVGWGTHNGKIHGFILNPLR